MTSQRNNIGIANIHNSKNTRMEFSRLADSMDYRKDELMHIGRYTNGAKTMVDISKKLGRPIRVLDVGCGEMNTVRLFNKSILEKADNVVSEYIGVDIDYIMVEKAKEKYSKPYKTCHARFIVKDLTVEPHLDFPDGYFDLIISFEFLEHINVQYSLPILKEIYRLLNKNGKALISTPNSNGSNERLPKDHIYEYSYEELCQMFRTAGLKLEKAVGVCANISRIPQEEKMAVEKIIRRYYDAFGENSNFAAVAIAPLFNPRNCKNVLYHLRKGDTNE